MGVACSFANSGFRTQVLSRNPDRLRGKLPSGVDAISELPDQAPDLIIESIPELATLKQELYAAVEHAYAGASILASNTSSLPLDELAKPLQYPDRFIGMHYFFPADVTEFVEVTRTAGSSDQTLQAVVEVLKATGKTPVILNRPVMGALINRLQHAMLREAYYLIGEGIVSPEQVDDVARRLLAPRMCVTGILEQKDISGLDTHALAQRSIVPHLYNSPEPAPYLQDLYKAGKFGLKTGSGFYEWDGYDPAQVRMHTSQKVAHIIQAMEEIGVGHGRSLPEKAIV